MDANVQVALVGGAFTIFGYLINSVQKTVDRFLQQKHFQNNAIGILETIKSRSEKLSESVTKLDGAVHSQSQIMTQMLQYSRQNAEAAVKMAEIVEDFVNGSPRR